MGGLIVVIAVAWIISLFAFRQMPPHRRAILTAGTAWVICAAIWGMFLTGSFVTGVLGFSLGAAIVGFERYVHYSKHWTDEPATGDDASIFQ